MERFLYRVHYGYADGTSSYESVCVRAADDDEAGAQAEVEDATARYLAVRGVSSRTLTLLLVTADV